MKKNIFYLMIGVVALVLLVIFGYSVENFTPVLFMIAFVIGVILLYLAYRKVDDFIEDERSARITEKAAMRTLQVFWVCFCAFSIMAVMNLLYMPRFSRAFWLTRENDIVPPELMSLKTIGYIQLGLLCLMIFLYVGFRIYYARKFGDWETDEE
ncbi:MAG: DUF2178 domain-containing protein [Methanoregula sp.]|uniref:DUF2178 domain-containing protein n=1 Tax=Methanoregula sp. TaxID=2052170 RepID=UPI003BAE798B